MGNSFFRGRLGFAYGSAIGETAVPDVAPTELTIRRKRAADLQGVELNYWVAVALGYRMESRGETWRVRDEQGQPLGFISENRPMFLTWLRWDQDWAQGGPLVDRLIGTGYVIMQGLASNPREAVVITSAFGRWAGKSVLEAACRAIVAQKFEYVPVPVTLP